MLTLFAALTVGNGLLNLLVTIAIVAIIIWGIVAIVQHMGLVIHPIVRIIGIVIISIVAILLLVRLLGLVVA